MPNKNYDRGADFEREVKNFLDERLTPGAIRSAGSHGPHDVAGHGLSFARLIQCKVPKKATPAVIAKHVAAAKAREVPQYASNEVWVAMKGGSVYVYAEGLPAIMDMLRAQMYVMFDVRPGTSHHERGMECLSWVVPRKRLSVKTSGRKSATGSRGIRR